MARRLLKAFRLALFIALGCAVLVFLVLWTEHLRGAFSLAKYRRELAVRGEATTPADLASGEPLGSNGAPAVVQAAGELIRGAVLPDHCPPRMKVTRAGRAVVGFRQPQWTEDKLTYNWAQLQNELQTNRTTLNRIRAALEQPVLDHHLDYSQGPKALFPQLIIAKRLTYWFGSECQLALHQNRLQDCCDALVAELRLPVFLARDQIVISELVRVALGAIARVDTWEALQAEGWTDQQLAQIQNAWTECRFLTNFTRSLEGERVFASTSFDFWRRSNAEAVSFLFWEEEFGDSEVNHPPWENFLRALPAGDFAAETLKKQIYVRIWRFAWLDQCERKYLGQVQQLVEISRAAEKTLSAVTARTLSDQLVAGSQNHGVYDSLRFSHSMAATPLTRAVTKAMRAETERSLALAAIALKRFSLQNTNQPDSLERLVPKFLDTVPIDYMDGKPIKYFIRNDRTPVLYSVGEDGIDGHGDTAPLDSSNPSANLWTRKDLAWPAPAPPEDVQDNTHQ